MRMGFTSWFTRLIPEETESVASLTKLLTWQKCINTLNTNSHRPSYVFTSQTQERNNTSLLSERCYIKPSTPPTAGGHVRISFWHTHKDTLTHRQAKASRPDLYGARGLSETLLLSLYLKRLTWIAQTSVYHSTQHATRAEWQRQWVSLTLSLSFSLSMTHTHTHRHTHTSYVNTKQKTHDFLLTHHNFYSVSERSKPLEPFSTRRDLASCPVWGGWGGWN